MSRRGGSIYISTDPLNNVPIGVAGEGISIGPMGTLIFGRGPDAVTGGGMELTIGSNLVFDMTNLELVMD